MTQYIARVRFTRRHHVYNRGEIAVFPLDEAERLVAMRVAEGLPPPIAAAPPSGAPEGGTGGPTRSPPSLVRK